MMESICLSSVILITILTIKDTLTIKVCGLIKMFLFEEDLPDLIILAAEMPKSSAREFRPVCGYCLFSCGIYGLLYLISIFNM